MHKAAVSLVAFLLIACANPALARDRDNQSLGAEMSRERAETRIERIKNDRAEKEVQQKRERARAQSPKPAKDPAKP